MRQHLIIDADDTLLGEQHLLRTRVRRVRRALAHSTLPPTDVRAVLDEIGRLAEMRMHAVQARELCASNLRQCYERLAERAIGEEESGHGDGLRRADSRTAHRGDRWRARHAGLSGRHELTLFQPRDARRARTLKMQFDRGLGRLLRARGRGLVEGMSRRPLAARRGSCADTRSIVDVLDNSPKSDINPALAVGLNAVFVPHTHAWVVEQQESGPVAVG